MTNGKSIAGIALAAVLLPVVMAGCERRPAEDDRAKSQTATPAAAVSAEATPATVSETTMAEPGVQPRDAAAFDAKAFAGTFEGTLPCADCPGIDERLVLSADGTFELSDEYRERPGSGQAVSGTWALEPDGRSLRLDPGSKDAQDRLFAIEGNDALVPLGADGQPTGAPGDPRLRRSR